MHSPSLRTILCVIFVWLSVFLVKAQALTPQQYDEQRITRLEDKVYDIKRQLPPQRVGVGGLSILFGAFCALWAQNTRRSAWLWFFLGFFFSVITVVVLLVKNSKDRVRREREELRGLHP